jgi:crossover junction endodeoxyribonuclease RuvC
VITTPSSLSRAGRLLLLQRELDAVIGRWQPQSAAVEQLFFGSNATTAMSVGEARGVILVTLEQRGVAVAEYQPAEVKRSLTGYGKAGKPQMMKMIRAVVGDAALPGGLPDDAYDAVAVALCHVQSRRLTAARTSPS